MPPPDKTALPNPFVFADGSPLTSVGDWARRRRELFDLVVGLEYGGLPPAPAATHGELLHATTLQAQGGAIYQTIRVVTQTEPAFSFLLQLTIPPGDGPFPVILNGDACWKYVTDEVAAEVLGRKFILAQFNRVALAPDAYHAARTSGIYPLHPGATYGALSAWAWGYHRCVDVLGKMPAVDATRIAITGHSRGGKTVLLAGATDERIALTCANNSGAGGAGCFRHQGPESETLADLLKAIAYWFGPALRTYAGRENELPFDQHFLKALIAPRALLTTEARADLWANPTGTWQTHRAAREVYRLLNAEERLGIFYREGDHAHSLADWRVLLDFAAWQFRGTPPVRNFAGCPFPDLPPSHSWSAPASS
ncbi:MAG: acetylxylan esterase [Opitutaceae bacterium]|nr:acetylxylan esterase [Opitutaceae bacterium]MBP9912442.1 acetylxylan esterase [Opitutaceae bacterium]